MQRESLSGRRYVTDTCDEQRVGCVYHSTGPSVHNTSGARVACEVCAMACRGRRAGHAWHAAAGTVRRGQSVRSRCATWRESRLLLV